MSLEVLKAADDMNGAKVPEQAKRVEIQVKAETLAAIARACKHVASEDVQRFNLTHVRVNANEQHPDRVVIEATDGHMLSRVKLIDAEFAQLLRELPLHTVFFHADQGPDLCRMVKKGRYFLATREGDRVRVSMVGDLSLISAQADFEWPNLDQVWPKTWPVDAFTVKFNPELLRALFLALQDDPSFKGVELTFNKPVDPIMVKVGDNAGLLMPMRK